MQQISTEGPGPDFNLTLVEQVKVKLKFSLRAKSRHLLICSASVLVCVFDFRLTLLHAAISCA